MTRPQSAAAELAAYLRNSPDVGIGDLGGLNLRNAGDLGAPAEETLAAVPSEHDEQCALFAWAAANEAAHPELKLLFAVPNGGFRHASTAAMLKASGTKAGVPDCCLPVARGRFHSLWIELKRKPNKPTAAQQEWIADLRYYGAQAIVCYGAQEAQQAIMAYLGQEG